MGEKDFGLVDVIKAQNEFELQKPVAAAQAKFWGAQALKEEANAMRSMGVTVALTDDQKDDLVRAFAESIKSFVS